MFDKNVHDDASFEQKSTKLSGAKLRRNNLVAENSAAKSRGRVFGRQIDVIRKHVDEEDKGVAKLETPWGPQKARVINESCNS